MFAFFGLVALVGAQDTSAQDLNAPTLLASEPPGFELGGPHSCLHHVVEGIITETTPIRDDASGDGHFSYHIVTIDLLKTSAPQPPPRMLMATGIGCGGGMCAGATGVAMPRNGHRGVLLLADMDSRLNGPKTLEQAAGAPIVRPVAYIYQARRWEGAQNTGRVGLAEAVGMAGDFTVWPMFVTRLGRIVFADANTNVDWLARMKAKGSIWEGSLYESSLRYDDHGRIQGADYGLFKEELRRYLAATTASTTAGCSPPNDEDLEAEARAPDGPHVTSGSPGSRDP